MVTYNKERTAYMREGRFGDSWYLLPRGRKRAPILGYEGPFLVPGYDGHLVDLITEEDREMLLDAEDAGVFQIVFRKIKYSLQDRHRAETVQKNKVAQKIIDSYRGD